MTFRELRHSRGWSLRSTAERSGLNLGTIQNVEDYGDCRISTMMALAQAFDVFPGVMVDVLHCTRLNPRCPKRYLKKSHIAIDECVK